jgi:hypothetical protein
VLVAFWCASALDAGMASAVVTRFGSKGEGAGQFNEPYGIAASQASGDVYVMDTGNARLESFGPEGSFRFAVGWGVLDGKNELEKCSATCLPGLPGSGAGQFKSAYGVAVDNSPTSASYGDVYVDDSTNYRVQKFDSAGNFILTFGKEVNHTTKGETCLSTEAEACGEGREELAPGAFYLSGGGIGLDTAGNVYVGDWARVEEFTSGGSFVNEFPVGVSGLVSTVAVTSSKEIYASNGEPGTGVHRYDALGNEVSSPVDTEGHPQSLTLGPSSELYVDDGFESEINIPRMLEFDSTGNEVKAFDIGGEEGKRGIAYSNGLDGVYVLQRQAVRLVIVPPPGPLVGSESVSEVKPTRATLNAVIDAENSATHYHFEYGESTGYGSVTSVAPLPSEGGLFGAEQASTEISGLRPSATYHYRVVAEDEVGHTTYGQDSTFTTLPPVTINAEFATQVTPESARLNVEMDPFGLPTKYHLEYGVTTSYGENAPSEDASTGAFEGSVATSVLIERLKSATTYHYRVVAQNSLGVVRGADHEFTTSVSRQAVLMDGRTWEMVSPANKNGASLEGIPEEGGIIQAAEHGGALTYIAKAPVSTEVEGTRSILFEQLLATRAAGGVWSTKDITTRHEQVAGAEVGTPAEYLFFSGDLKKAVVEPEGATPLSPLATERTPYRREASGEFVPLLTQSDVTSGVKYGGREEPSEHFIGGATVTAASRDDEAVALTSPSALTTDFTTPESEQELGAVYLWREGKLSLVSWLPGTAEEPLEMPAPLADVVTSVGSSRGGIARHTVTEHGNRVIYAGEGANGNGRHLFLRDMRLGKSVQLDLREDGTSGPGARVNFQDASADGSVVYFTDEEHLKAGATGTSEEPDLYECEVEEVAGNLHCSVRLLTVPLNSGERSAVFGNIVGTDEHGDKVYFVANGQLTPNAAPGDCVASQALIPTTANVCNLYMYDNADHTVRLVAVLSNSDAADWGIASEAGGKLSNQTSRVSPDGRYLAFMSERSLTGYDNRDANSGALDEEVFEYDSVTDSLVCVSCDPTGARPVGVFDAGQYPGLLSDRGDAWRQHWLAADIPSWTRSKITTYTMEPYQSRYLADDGRLFFNSSDGLVAQDVNSAFDVYEYEPDSTGGCERAAGCVALMSSGTAGGETAFVDASDEGEDVFFLTTGRLVKEDADSAYDMYDAHVCSASSPCSGEESGGGSTICEEVTSCRTALAPVALPAIASPPLLDNGNKVESGVAKAKRLTRAQLLAKAIRECRKKRGAHRRFCEARARKQYGGRKVTRARRHRRGK